MKKLPKIGEIAFDFSRAKHAKSHIENLSGLAIRGDIAWTVSDERATFECFKMEGGRFELIEQFGIEDFFPTFPSGEVDLEAIDWRDETLWLCGSHSSVETIVDGAATLEKKPSRRLLGAIRLLSSTMPVRESATLMPIRGEGSLRSLLRS